MEQERTEATLEALRPIVHAGPHADDPFTGKTNDERVFSFGIVSRLVKEVDRLRGAQI